MKCLPYGEAPGRDRRRHHTGRGRRLPRFIVLKLGRIPEIQNGLYFAYQRPGSKNLAEQGLEVSA